ncbi:MAG TPA: prephenate dehydrogenase/arogenate dehydrogenase family protein [Desulfotomaculum sp.]|nr:prephenate dehydrogenase/arogenate dehydrogenase family protein [Desulfotomaculum sp.]
MFRRVAIIGVGLIGGSFGLTLRKFSLAEVVVGAGRNPENTHLAVKRGALHHGYKTAAEAVANAELVYLSTPVKAIIPTLKEILPYLSPDTIITDAGSTKAEVVRQAESILPPDIFFIGGHPMAGSEQSGIKAASDRLFNNAFYIFTPTEKSSPTALARLKTLAKGLGARVVEMSPEKHDCVVTAISHLPHLIAACLVNTLLAFPDKENFLPLAAGGFKDTTRIAAGSPEMWRDIFLSNQEMVLTAANFFRHQLSLFEEAIARGNGQAIFDFLEQARKIRAGL